MNLLNKKIKDKIKLLDDIDKQYIPKVQSKPHLNENPFQVEEKNIKTNSSEINKKAPKENFDKVYSNFILSGGLLKQNLNLNKRNHSLSNNNCDKYPTKENTINNEIDNVGERLNNYGRYIKSKKEVQRRMENNRIKNKSKPTINKTRNKTEKIERRLIPNYSNNCLNTNSKVSNNITNKNKHNNSTRTIDEINNFTYHPKLNKKSLLLAKKMEPSSIRLNKKKKIKEENDIKPKMFYVNLYKHKQNSTPRKTSKKKDDNKTIIEKMNNLYKRGIEQRQKKEKKISENKQKKAEEYKQFSFKPNINKVIPYYSTKNKIKKNLSLVLNGTKTRKNKSKRDYKKLNIYEKNIQWKQKIEKENIQKKKLNEEKEQKLCTFHPKIIDNATNISNKKYLNKVFEEINAYMLKRRQNIKYKESKDNYIKKKFYIGGEGYTPRSTIPKEFEFQTEIRERSLGKNKNRSCEHFHVNKNSGNKTSDKKSFGENENRIWFFKDEMSTNGYNYNSNISNINESKGNKEPSHSQFDFIEAVNILHDKLDKLNI